MSEQMFLRNGRWVPRSQIVKDKKEIVVEESNLSEDELDILREKKIFLESLSRKKLNQMAKEMGIKYIIAKNKEKLVHEILLASQ